MIWKSTREVSVGYRRFGLGSREAKVIHQYYYEEEIHLLNG